MTKTGKPSNIGLQIIADRELQYAWMKGNVWRIKMLNVRVSVNPEKTSWTFKNISEIFHEIFQGKKFNEILHH